VTEKLLRPGDAAKYLGITPEVLAAQARAQKVPHQFTPGGHRRYKLTELQKIANPEGGNNDNGTDKHITS
jgi:hypothetical protein